MGHRCVGRAAVRHSGRRSAAVEDELGTFGGQLLPTAHRQGHVGPAPLSSGVQGGTAQHRPGPRSGIAGRERLLAHFPNRVPAHRLCSGSRQRKLAAVTAGSLGKQLLPQLLACLVEIDSTATRPRSASSRSRRSADRSSSSRRSIRRPTSASSRPIGNETTAARSRSAPASRRSWSPVSTASATSRERATDETRLALTLIPSTTSRHSAGTPPSVAGTWTITFCRSHSCQMRRAAAVLRAVSWASAAGMSTLTYPSSP